MRQRSKCDHSHSDQYPLGKALDLQGVYTIRQGQYKDGSVQEDRVTVEVGRVTSNIYGGSVTSLRGTSWHRLMIPIMLPNLNPSNSWQGHCWYQYVSCVWHDSRRTEFCDAGIPVAP